MRAQELELGGVHPLDPDCVAEYDSLLILAVVAWNLNRCKSPKARNAWLAGSLRKRQDHAMVYI
jgi:hypothetical protein